MAAKSNDHQTTEPGINQIAQAIFDAYQAYHHRFKTFTRQVANHFQKRDWTAYQKDALKRLELYPAVIDTQVPILRRRLKGFTNEHQNLTALKNAYFDLIRDCPSWEIAETFYNSIIRHVFEIVGVEPDIEFVTTGIPEPPNRATRPIYQTFIPSGATAPLIRTIAQFYALAPGFADLERDSRIVGQRIDDHLASIGALRTIDRVEMVNTAFYRGMGAYLIGRLYSGSMCLPLVLALVNRPAGICIDALLMEERPLSILFSFTRSYFHVDIDRPSSVVRFIKSLLPRKRIAEIYISLGYNKHGKTELFRELQQHLAYCCEERFDFSRGKRGMVMLVYNMPNDDLVFKIIRDRFAQPKKATHEDVRRKYDLVFKHDRAGRLVDTQEFDYLKFHPCCFSDDLMAAFTQKARRTVIIDPEAVVFKHVYVQRRVIPLDIYIKEADHKAAEAAVRDFGQTIKDLAAGNIFPGDLLLKNFGVTPKGRVVFYDYDELTLVTDCNFRNMPQAVTEDDELAGEPWFYVDENDVFPQELQNFLGLAPALKQIFMQHHDDLFTVAFWEQIKQRLLAGQIMPIFPYAAAERLGTHEAIN